MAPFCLLTPEKAESEEEDGIENDSENSENIEDCDQRKTIKVKPFGGPLLAQAEISTSQQDFSKLVVVVFIQGPDYNSESESERAAETARLKYLLKNWETASAGPRSLPATPKRRPPAAVKVDGVRSAEIPRDIPRPPRELMYPRYDADGAAVENIMEPIYDRIFEHFILQFIPQNVIHQSYGVTQAAYRQVNYSNPSYIPQNSPHQMAYPSAMQYQAISPMFTSQPTSPIKTYVSSSPKHIPYEQPATYSPTHKLYGPPVPVAKPAYTNGELLQQQLYNHHGMQYQQYKEAREQVLAQHQQQTVYRGPQRNYQSSVTIPIVVKSNQQNDVNSLHRKQYELT
ncbi:hypothetical protein NQ317_004684 [Molorchus minor]|uniref:Uncharacterized protein n=1 Tax=Molorchus minor TaxID=1323400 RepID=A0ABQ9JEM3_9CUCU|nr:hypothetical protein NQ317_004684 [Molorchus minor]